MEGVSQVRPGWWKVDPVQNSYARTGGLGKVLEYFSKRALEEAKLAPVGRNSFADATQNAIDDAAWAAGQFTQNPDMRLLLNVAPSGNRADAALAYTVNEAEKAYGFPSGTQYIKWVGAPVRGKGREAIRVLQEEEGPNTVLQAWMGGDHDNIEGYQKMGFQFALPNDQGLDALGGHKSLPAMEIYKMINDFGPKKNKRLVRMSDGDLLEKQLVDDENTKQMRFPDFKRGGLARVGRR